MKVKEAPKGSRGLKSISRGNNNKWEELNLKIRNKSVRKSKSKSHTVSLDNSSANLNKNNNSHNIHPLHNNRNKNPPPANHPTSPLKHSLNNKIGLNLPSTPNLNKSSTNYRTNNNLHSLTQKLMNYSIPSTFNHKIIKFIRKYRQ
jgi:hypothetical protein